MSASDLHESMKDPVVLGQYLTAIRNRGKDVLIADVTKAMDLLIEMAVKVQSAERERDELRAELKRRDAAASEPVAVVREVINGLHVTLYQMLPPGTELFTAAPPASVPDIEPFIEGALKLHGLRTAADGHSQLSDGFRSGARWAVRELGAQPQKPVELPGYLSYAGIPDEYTSFAEEIAHQRGFEHGVKRCKEALDAANVPYEVKP